MSNKNGTLQQIQPRCRKLQTVGDLLYWLNPWNCLVEIMSGRQRKQRYQKLLEERARKKRLARSAKAFKPLSVNPEILPGTYRSRKLRVLQREDEYLRRLREEVIREEMHEKQLQAYRFQKEITTTCVPWGKPTGLKEWYDPQWREKRYSNYHFSSTASSANYGRFQSQANSASTMQNAGGFLGASSASCLGSWWGR